MPYKDPEKRKAYDRKRNATEKRKEYERKRSKENYPRKKEYFKEYRKKYRIEHKEYFSEHAHRYYKGWYARNKEKMNSYMKEYYQRSPEHSRRREIRQEVTRAVAKGILQKSPCEVCDSEKVHAHHEDYSKALEVRWLCPLHHKQVHQGRIVIN